MTAICTSARAALYACLASVGLAAVSAPAVAQEQQPLSDYVEAWLQSPHADHHSLSFTYWNEAGAVPQNCAACHSEPGFIDYLGADGSTPMVVDHPAPINAVIGCAACHTSAAHALDAVPFPSGVTVSGLGHSAVCTVCHQGRASGDAVAAATSGQGDDDVLPDQGFINVHYGVAAAVMQGAEVRAGFHYPGRSYAGPFGHVPSANTCTACHDAHTTRVETDGCLTCHRGVEDIRDIRTRHGDFDGDGDASGGIHAEIIGLHARLLDAIRTYSAAHGGPIGYAPGTFPYFFADLDGDGIISPDEAIFPNRYQAWTPRLLRAAYNYQVAAKDKGGYVHNPAYLLQLLHDSIHDLAQGAQIDTRGLSRP